jgi:autotransporter strand-loop-strand O-heptosyltransferase
MPSDAPRPVTPEPAAALTQEGPHGIRYDFNVGARILLPSGAKWHLTLRDLDTGNILFDTHNEGASVSSAKRFYVRFGIDIWRDGEHVMTHHYDARDRDVLIQVRQGALGDAIGWFSYVERFQLKHGCRLTCAMSPLLIPLFEGAYPHIRFVTHEQVEEEGLADKAYATYNLYIAFNDVQYTRQPVDFQAIGLHQLAGYVLGVDLADIAPRLALPDESRPIAEPYVCIATQSSTQAKYWNNPEGWPAVIAFLKAAGYRVLCIDQKRTNGVGLMQNHMPHGVEDFTGDIPLVERARYLRHAAAFVGLSSGLAWLAWCAGCPVVMISGFTHPTNEFHTPYRVINWHVCNSCWNDVRVKFSQTDYMWCPRHANTPQQFECTRLITAHQVMNTIKKIPGFTKAKAA